MFSLRWLLSSSLLLALVTADVNPELKNGTCWSETKPTAKLSRTCLNETVSVSYPLVKDVKLLYQGLRLEPGNLFEMKLPDQTTLFGVNFTKNSGLFAYAKIWNAANQEYDQSNTMGLGEVIINEPTKPFSLLIVFRDNMIGYGNGSFIEDCKKDQPTPEAPCTSRSKIPQFQNRTDDDAEVHWFQTSALFPVIAIDHHKKYDLASATFTKISPNAEAIEFPDAQAVVNSAVTNAKERLDDSFYNGAQWYFPAVVGCFFFGLFLGSSSCCSSFHFIYSSKLKNLKERKKRLQEGEEDNDEKASKKKGTKKGSKGTTKASTAKGSTKKGSTKKGSTAKDSKKKDKKSKDSNVKDSKKNDKKSKDSNAKDSKKKDKKSTAKSDNKKASNNKDSKKKQKK